MNGPGVELSLEQVHAGYGPVEVLHGVDLQVPRGAVTALLGANGAGKTTTMAVISGTLPVRAGAVRWAGQVVNRVATYDRAHAGMVLIPEKRGIFPDLTVRDNLAIFAHGGPHDDDFTPAYDAFPVLRGRLAQGAGSLSGGEQQMLAMSRALLRKPRLLLLDEISFGLAPRITAQLFEVVAELARQDTTVLLVEQYLGEALRMADVVYVLARGEVAFAGEPAELAHRKALPGYATV
ncbi:MAG TPA: ABC transporter ATP-binding protein [Nocardioidaceae bacterium]|jgi:branched-chain amino acid transport system ATP-binding protein|nr:ABC transporter ATP-binding protein [Nocardioidaceae bacterium]